MLVGPGASGKSTWAASTSRPPTSCPATRCARWSGAGRGRPRRERGRLRAARRRRAPAGRARPHDRRRHARAGRRAPGGVARAGARARDAVRRGRLRHPGRGLPRAQPRPATTDPGRRRSTAQLRAWAATRDALAGEGFDRVLGGRAGARGAAPAFAGSRRPRPQRQREEPRTGLRFGAAPGRVPGGARLRAWVRGPAQAAEEAGLRRRLRDGPLPADPAGRPRLGRLPRELHDAGLPRRLHRAGAAGRARHRDHVPQRRAPGEDRRHAGRAQRRPRGVRARAWPGSRTSTSRTAGRSRRPRERYALLEDALQLLPLLWGPGSPAFAGRVLDVPEAVCYPRPLQEHVPIVVGGGGERRTLRLAAQYADAANVLGDLATVRRKAAVLREHCAAVGRDRRRCTHLSTALVGEDDRHVAELVDARRPRGRSGGGLRRRRQRRHGRGPRRPVPRARRRRASARWCCGSSTRPSMEPMARVIARFREEAGT